MNSPLNVTLVGGVASFSHTKAIQVPPSRVFSTFLHLVPSAFHLEPRLVTLSHILPKRIWGSRAGYFFFFSLKPATCFVLLPLPGFVRRCLSSLVFTKEDYPKNGALGKNSDQ